MKKVILVFIVCVILVGITYICWNNPETFNNISVNITSFFENIFGRKVVVYNNDFKINTLQLKRADYYYNNILDEKQKMLYNQIAVAVKELEKNVKIKEYTYVDKESALKDTNAAIEAFLADHPEVFYLNNKYFISAYENVFGNKMEIQLEYLVSNKKEVEEKINEIQKEIDRYIVQLNGNTGIEAEIILHDLFATQVKYYKFSDIENIDAKYHNIYSAFVEKEGVCDAFAKAMQILLDKAAIESILITGNLNGNSHAWNMIKLDDEWYHLDITSNKSIHTKDNIPIHSYFNLTTLEIKSTHEISKIESIPKAIDTKFNYYIYKDKYISSVENFDAKFRQIIKSNKDSSILEFLVEQKNSIPEKIISYLSNTNNKEYIDLNKGKLAYYNVLNSYIINKVN